MVLVTSSYLVQRQKLCAFRFGSSRGAEEVSQKQKYEGEEEEAGAKKES